jgi:hypothetical protein
MLAGSFRRATTGGGRRAMLLAPALSYAAAPSGKLLSNVDRPLR